MLSYRHAYHAGNPADVFKHLVYIQVIEHLQAKPKPIRLIDTHAGAGRYPVTEAMMQQRREYRRGILALWAEVDGEAPAAIRTLIDRIREAESENATELRVYPGSPRLAQACLREADRLLVNERHPRDRETLRTAMRGDRRVRVRGDCGYALLNAVLPPPERRGAVLCDPAYERRDEAAALVDGMRNAWRRWPTGVYLLWYPLHPGFDAPQLKRRLTRLAPERLLALEWRMHAPRTDHRLAGSGLLLLNPPWRIEAALEPAGAWLTRHWGDASGGLRMEPLV